MTTPDDLTSTRTHAHRVTEASLIVGNEAAILGVLEGRDREIEALRARVGWEVAERNREAGARNVTTAVDLNVIEARLNAAREWLASDHTAPHVWRMNPPTPGPLTVLLIAPPGDTALLADECGGVVPVMHFDRIAGSPSGPCPVCGSPTRWFRPPTDQMDPCYICTADSGHDFPDAAVAPMGWQAGRQRGPYGSLPLALLLVHEGAPVAMGCDRLARSMNVLPYGAYTEAWAHTMGRAYAGEHPGARVVLLRDGREVTE